MVESSSSVEECPLQRQHSTRCEKKPQTLKGPLRVARLCILGIVVPAILLGAPLYLRYKVYGHQLYPLAASDMRVLDNKVSTTWCQRQLVKVNTTFNAFLLPKPPELSLEVKHLSMTRHLMLEDDMKEYWGFYLLKGSSVTVSTCVRWPGASLIVIRGHRHLHECAYIGDDSSEELDELMEAIREGVYVDKLNIPQRQDNPANQPDLMKRHRSDVEFHHPSHKNKTEDHHRISGEIEIGAEVTDPRIMEQLLEAIRNKKKKKKEEEEREEELENNPHVRRNQTVAKNEEKNLQIEAPLFQAETNSDELLGTILDKLRSMGEKGSTMLDKINTNYHKTQNNDNEQTFDTVGRHYHKPAVDFNENVDSARRRRRRDIVIKQTIELNKDDGANDHAEEDGFSPKPDGIADHRGRINESTVNDMSNSEFWSSFSSSEEILLNCKGLILNLPLTPHSRCDRSLSEEQIEEAYLANTVTYTVPANGYYFFVFNSENEVQKNYVRVHFRLKKAVYNVSDAVSTCPNTTGSCAINLGFFSSEKLVVELPVDSNETLWNEEFVVVSECEPRTALYVVCVMMVPVFVFLFAFT